MTVLPPDNTPDNLSIHVYFFAYAHSIQPISHLQISPYEIVFHTQPRFPLKCQLNLPRNSFRECNVQFCSEVPPHSACQSVDFYPLFHIIILKPISTSFLAIKTAMLHSSISIRNEKTNFLCIYSAILTQFEQIITIEFICFTSKF